MHGSRLDGSFWATLLFGLLLRGLWPFYLLVIASPKDPGKQELQQKQDEGKQDLDTLTSVKCPKSKLNSLIFIFENSCRGNGYIDQEDDAEGAKEKHVKSKRLLVDHPFVAIIFNLLSDFDNAI